MRILWQHILQILAQYGGELPLHHFLKGYFKRHPKLGSRDRKAISQAVYSWYRAGKAFEGDAIHSRQEQVLAAMYLCGGASKILAGEEHGFYMAYPGSPAGATRELRKGHVVEHWRIIPQGVGFSSGTDGAEWLKALLQQPRLFLRIRKDKSGVSAAVQDAGIAHEWLTETCLALPNGTKTDGLLPEDCYVIQDTSSQATGRYLQALPGDAWWDCCAGAGGKSLMLRDGSPGVSLLATDLRQSILQNLAERFRRYHHSLPQMLTLDASDAAATARALGSRRFDGVICDVPCTGSGTWARTPESCYFFNPASVADYAARQKAILRNACDYVKKDGRIIYITCSVFRAENEEVVEAIAGEGSIQIVSAGLINGLAIGGDALYAAELRRT